MLPAIRYVLGNIKHAMIPSLDEIRDRKPDCDIFCVNCAMSFYDLELFFNSFEEIYGAEKRPIFFLPCLGGRAL